MTITWCLHYGRKQRTAVNLNELRPRLHEYQAAALPPPARTAERWMKLRQSDRRRALETQGAKIGAPWEEMQGAARLQKWPRAMNDMAPTNFAIIKIIVMRALYTIRKIHVKSITAKFIEELIWDGLQTNSSSLVTLVLKLMISSRGMKPAGRLGALKPLEASTACLTLPAAVTRTTVFNIK